MKRSFAFLAPALAIAALAAFALARILPALPAAGGLPVSFAWITYANTALAGSTVLYVAHFWFRSEPVGRSATLLAALGALGVVASLALNGTTGADGHRSGVEFGLYEGTAVFSSAAVLAHLAMERIYRSRETALLVMPVVMLGVLCEIWLVARGVAMPSRPAPELDSYWDAGQRFAVGLGYSAFSAAAVLSVLVLVQHAAEDADAHARQVAGILGAAAVGLALLLLGGGMGAIGSLLTDASAYGIPAGLLTAPALVISMALLVLAQWHGYSARRLAWCQLGAFAMATVSLLSAGWLAETLIHAAHAA